MVNEASEFPEALHAFKKWIKTFDEQFILCSWGHYDRVQFKNDCVLNGLDTKWTENHISLKHQYAKFKKLRRPIGMKKALKREKLALTGTHHRGIDDVRNIAKIFIKYFDKWSIKSDLVILFWDGESTGIREIVRYLQDQGGSEWISIKNYPSLKIDL